jgi:hypothetical protein
LLSLLLLLLLLLLTIMVPISESYFAAKKITGPK